MKHRKQNLTLYAPPCPNAADDAWFARRALDILTGLISIAGFVTAMGVLVILS